MAQILLLLPDTHHQEYITVIEQACMKLEPHNAEELRAEMRGAQRNSQEPKRNITKQEVLGTYRARERPIKGHPHSR